MPVNRKDDNDDGYSHLLYLALAFPLEAARLGSSSDGFILRNRTKASKP
jgi:hypothetical protein